MKVVSRLGVRCIEKEFDLKKSQSFLFFIIFSMNFPLSPLEGLKESVPLVATYPYSVNMTSLNVIDFLKSIDLVKDIGFKGIKLGNTECYYYDGRLLEAVQNISKKGLIVTIPIRWYNGLDYDFPYPAEAYQNIEQFPNNETQLNWFIEHVYNVTKLLKNEKVDRYSVYYPFNWQAFAGWKVMAESMEYKNALQRIINAIHNADENAKIYLASELMEKEGVKLPTDFEHIKGFGYQPYSFDMSTIDEPLITYLNDYWLKKGKDVYIDEWGWRTQGVYAHGKTYNETWKAKLIKEEVKYLGNMKTCWTYFGLYDFPPENADWGIAYNNHT